MQVVGRGSAQHQAVLSARGTWRAPPRRNGDGKLPGEIAAGERIGIGLDLRQHALGQQLAAKLARSWTQVEQVVGRAQHIGVVLDDEDGVAQVAQLLKNMNQPRRVPGVQPDGRLVQNIERAHQLRAERGGQLNALRLAAGEGRRKAIEGEVFQAHRVQKTQPLANFFENRAGNLLVHGRKPQRTEKLLCLCDGERGCLADIPAPVLTPDAHAASLGPEALAAALRALGVAAILAQHHAHMQLVLFALHLLKEAVDPGKASLAAQNDFARRLWQIFPGNVQPNAQLRRLTAKLGKPRAVFGAVPGIDRPVAEAEFLVGDDQVQIEVHRVTEALAARTCPERIIETEQARLRLAACAMTTLALVRY